MAENCARAYDLRSLIKHFSLVTLFDARSNIAVTRNSIRIVRAANAQPETARDRERAKIATKLCFH